MEEYYWECTANSLNGDEYCLQCYLNQLYEEEYYHDYYKNSMREKEYDYDCYESEEDFGGRYGEYEGCYAQDGMGYSDDVIDDVFEGDPDAYWNID